MMELGLLLGELKQHMENSAKRHKELTERIDRVETKLEELNRLRWRIAGGTAAVTGLLAFMKLIHEIGKG